MLVRYRRTALAAAMTAAAIAVPVAAFASGPGSPAPKPGHPATAVNTKPAGISRPAAGSQPSGALASPGGISQSRLDKGLAAAKRAGGNNAAGITSFAQAAGVSHATAQRIVSFVFGKGGTGALGRIKSRGARR
jgi:hypothetical protein